MASNITGLVDALVSTGFVTREPHPTDRRATLVTLTDHGKKTVTAMDRDQQEFAKTLFGGPPRQAWASTTTGTTGTIPAALARSCSLQISGFRRSAATRAPVS